MKSGILKTLAVASIASLILSGCGGGASVDQALLKSCDALTANLKKMAEIPDFEKADIPGETFQSSDEPAYIAMNLGNKTRADAKATLLKTYPYLADRINAVDGNAYELSNIHELELLEAAIVGTGFKITLTSEERASLKNNLFDPSYKTLKEQLDLIVGSVSDSDQLAGCAVIDKYHEDNPEEGSTFYAMMDGVGTYWSKALDSTYSVIKLAGIINECERTHSYGGDRCGTKDYVGSGDTGTSGSTEVTNPWERTFNNSNTEAVAKTAWCISHGSSDYDPSSDSCVG
jgi:hypothetical protein